MLKDLEIYICVNSSFLPSFSFSIVSDSFFLFSFFLYLLTFIISILSRLYPKPTSGFLFPILSSLLPIPLLVSLIFFSSSLLNIYRFSVSLISFTLSIQLILSLSLFPPLTIFSVFLSLFTSLL